MRGVVGQAASVGFRNREPDLQEIEEKVERIGTDWNGFAGDWKGGGLESGLGRQWLPTEFAVGKHTKLLETTRTVMCGRTDSTRSPFLGLESLDTSAARIRVRGMVGTVGHALALRTRTTWK